jgi:transposase
LTYFGTVNNLRLEASNAVESAIEEAKIYVHNSRVVGADETSFVQRDVDGCNDKKSHFKFVITNRYLRK